VTASTPYRATLPGSAPRLRRRGLSRLRPAALRGSASERCRPRPSVETSSPLEYPPAALGRLPAEVDREPSGDPSCRAFVGCETTDLGRSPGTDRTAPLANQRAEPRGCKGDGHPPFAAERARGTSCADRFDALAAPPVLSTYRTWPGSAVQATPPGKARPGTPFNLRVAVLSKVAVTEPVNAQTRGRRTMPGRSGARTRSRFPTAFRDFASTACGCALAVCLTCWPPPRHPAKLSLPTLSIVRRMRNAQDAAAFAAPPWRRSSGAGQSAVAHRVGRSADGASRRSVIAGGPPLPHAGWSNGSKSKTRRPKLPERGAPSSAKRSSSPAHSTTATRGRGVVFRGNRWSCRPPIRWPARDGGSAQEPLLVRCQDRACTRIAAVGPGRPASEATTARSSVRSRFLPDRLTSSMRSQ